jgi:DNA polymerase I-like protein with 3'-5' exonuclease and polymerase domains
MEFPINYPAHLAELTGIKLDTERLEQVKQEKLEQVAAMETRLAKLVGVPGFNCGSPKQVKALTKMLAGQELPSTDEKNLVKLAGKHPLNKLLVDLILEIRGERKLVSTYLKDSIAFSFEGACPEPRIVYSINPHGTDTGRNASKAHHFWVGLNIQNIPRGDTIKQIALAEPDFLFGEADYSQAETRGTGYVTGETKLIDAVEGKLGYKDFHSYNASAFFGTPYEQIYDDASGKTLDKALRDLSKRVNHGANYNMGATVLVDTMGETNVYKAGRILGLPLNWSAVKIAEYLLNAFDKTYPAIRGAYQTWVKVTIATTKKLVGATGWTRYCFGNPSTNKLDLNAYVAHTPQSLNAMMVNKAFMAVFYKVWLPNPKHFMLQAQIHDSILFQYHKDYPQLADQVAECMHIPTPVTDINGVTRTLVVPTDIKIGGARWDGE